MTCSTLVGIATCGRIRQAAALTSDYRIQVTATADAPPASRTALPDDAPLPGLPVLAVDLADRADDLESSGVDRSVVAELAAAGTLAVFGPRDLGGLDAAGQRRTSEWLAGASPDAWFVWFQHGPVIKSLRASENTALADRYVADLCAGRALGGVAWSNLRTAEPSVRADRVDGGWQLSGFQPFCTGWPLLDLVLVGGYVAGPDGKPEQVVFGVLPTEGLTGLVDAGRLRLASMDGTATHMLRYDGLVLPDENVTALVPFAQWRAADRAGNTNVQPSTFGIALAALAVLAEREPEAADQLAERVLAVRAEAYRLIDEVDPGEQLELRLQVRARALRLALDCTTALVAGRGGLGMTMAQPAQRLLRAAAFQLVHSQDPQVRAATLQEYVSR